MTIGMAYVRKLPSGDEIVLASDSRLSGGESWDECQKVFPLDRGDCALAFAGAANRFVPIFNQIVTFCNLHKRIYSRAMPLDLLSRRLKQVSEHLLEGVKDHPDKFPDGAFQFILCGWHWQIGKPVFYKFSYDERAGRITKGRKRLNARIMRVVHPVLFIGDCVDQIKKLYNQIADPKDVQLDLQPLRIIQQIIDKGEIRSIGGVVQGVKLYRHLNTLPLAVHRGPDRYVFGRKLFPWERVNYEVAEIQLDGLSVSEETLEPKPDDTEPAEFQ